MANKKIDKKNIAGILADWSKEFTILAPSRDRAGIGRIFEGRVAVTQTLLVSHSADEHGRCFKRSTGRYL